MDSKDDREILDITDWNGEFARLREKLSLLEKRFIAVGLDYQHYIDDTWGQKEIYQLRDDLSYRLFCSQFHVDLLLRHHIQILNALQARHKNEPEFFTRQYLGANPWFEQFSKEISGIFDSMVYHCASTFDYVSTLSNYICGPNKQEKFKWTQLTRSVRDVKNNNPFTKTKIASVVDQIDKEFVGKLYSHRSHV